MKKYTQIALLVALALILVMTACQRQASTAPVTTPTTAGEPPFPVDNNTPVAGGLDAIATQTAAAQAAVQQPAAGDTPNVAVITETPAPGTGDANQGGGQQAAQPTATTAAAPAAAVSLPAMTRPASYTLQKGEWPLCIARRFDLDIPTFFQQNGLSMASKPGVGTVLKIPTTGNWNANYGARTLAKHPVTYTVAAGDNIYSIACKYGDVTPEQIQVNNGLASLNDIKTGQTLNIP